MISNVNETKFVNNKSPNSSKMNASNSYDSSLTNANSNKSSELKSYLIEKLIKEGPDKSSYTKLLQPSKSDNYFNGLPILSSQLVKSDSKGDLASEAGTYTVDEPSPDPNADQPIVEVISARAAIDETFGIVQRPNVSESEEIKQTEKSARRANRIRNATYSLKDIIQQEKQPNSSFSETPSSSSSSLFENQQVNVNEVKLKKTTTYNVINGESETSRTISTDILLGDTEHLMEQIKKNRDAKKEKLRNQNANKAPLPSQSSSSASVSLANHNNSGENKLNTSWTIPTTPGDHNENEENYLLSTRATVNFDDTKSSTPNTIMHLNRVGNGGMAFDFLLDDELTLNNTKTIPVLKSSFKKKERSGDQDDATTTRSSTSTTLTLTKKFEATRASSTRRVLKDENQSTASSSSSQCKSPKSPKSPKSVLSLGTRIQSKAKENNNNQSSNITKHKKSNSVTSNGDGSNESINQLHYTNRALQLRQLSSKARIDSAQKKAATQSSKPTITSRKVTNSATTSRTTSPYGNGSGSNGHTSVGVTHRNALMTTSLNLSNGQHLPSSSKTKNANDLFIRRKNYDPIKAVEMEKLKKRQNSESSNSAKVNRKSDNLSVDTVTPFDENNNGKNISMNDSVFSVGDNDSMSESYNSFSLPLQTLASSISNKQNYETILESTLQRLCIRLIQMSTAVLDKIGDNSSKKYDNSSIFNGLKYTTELERMQQLAKLVNSMQLVSDHVQVIDATLFSSKPEDSYIKELTRIRKEVDSLKQKASLNSSTSSINSLIVNTNGTNGVGSRI